jgi:predicted O-methyltransferase YrrM
MIEFTEMPRTPLEVGFLIPYYRSLPISTEFHNLNANAVAMVHPDVLALMYHLAGYAKGAVVELGAYVGGSAIAMAWGLRDRNREQKVVSVELGGKYDHPTVGTDDIVRDLRKNIKKYDMARYSEIVVGNSRDPQIVRKVHDLVAGAKLGLLCMDSDGDVRADFALYGHLLDSNAYLIIDDYFSPGAPEKVGPTRDGIEELERKGILESLGVYGWGTWVGRVR